MATNAEQFVVEIAAKYTGAGEIARLQNELDKLGQVENLQRLRREFVENIEAMRKAGEEAARLAAEMQNTADPQLQRRHEEQIRLQERHAQAAAALRERIAQTATALRQQGVNTQNLAAEQQRLNTATDATGRQLAAMRTLGVQSFSAIEERVRQLRQAWDDLDRSNMSMRERFAHWTQYQQRLSEAREQTNGWTASVQRLQAGWAGVLGVLGGLSVVRSAIREFGEFESAMLKVQALTRASGEDFDKLNAKAKELGATTRYTAAEAAEGMSQLAAAGMTAEQVYGTIPGVLDAAAASGMAVGETADKVTNIMSQFGLEADKTGKTATHVADVLTVGFTGAATTMQQLSDAMVYCGPVANALGYSLEETTAILQALANAGYKGEQAGTALRGGFTRLLRPARMAREVLEQYNIQVYEANGTVRKFTDIMHDLREANLSAAEMIKLFGQEAGPGMMALLAQGEEAILKYEEALGKADGRAKEMAEHMESGIEGALRRLGAAISAIAIAFGDTFAPAIAAAADQLAGLASWIANLPGPVKAFVGILTGAAAAFAMWKLGLNTMCLALRQFVLDMGAASAAAYRYATVTLPAYVAEMRLAGATTSAFRLVLNRTAADLPLVGKLLAANTRDLLLFRGAATRAGAALRLVGAAGMALLAWDVGKMVGNWLSKFALVRKAAISLAHGLNLAALYAQKMWAVLTGGNALPAAREIAAAKDAYRSMMEEIDAESAKTAEAAVGIQESITRKTREEAEKQLGIIEGAVEDEREAYESLDEGLKDDFDWDADKAKESKRKATRQSSAGKAKEPEEEPYWQQLYDEVEAREKEERERRAGAVDGLAEALAAAEEHARRWQEETAAAGAAKIAEAAGSLNEAARLQRRETAEARPDEDPRRPDRVVELKLGNARLSGSERDVEDFVAQLERGMATA